MRHFVSILERNPALASIGSALSAIYGVIVWFVSHTDDIGRVFGLVAVVFATVTSYCVMRIKWRQMKSRMREMD